MTKRWCGLRQVVCGVLCVLVLGCASTGGRRGVPEWVYSTAAVEAQYPRQRYFVGMGVCGGAGVTDVMSRRQAEAMAVADIASVVEVQINDTIEDHDTSVERNGRLLEQNVRIQTTRRVVTGMLSGVEIRDVFFDERTLNWHALAVLDRAQAGAGANEAVTQRLAEGRRVLAGLGHGPVHDMVALKRLERTLSELDRLAVALAIFAPERQGAHKAAIVAFEKHVAAARLEAGRAATVSVVVRGNAGGTLPDGLREAAVRVLAREGFAVRKGPTAGTLRVDVQVKVSKQVGALTLFEAIPSARFALLEHGDVVLEGEVPDARDCTARYDSEARARARSLTRLVVPLEAGLSAMFAEGE